MPNVWFCGISLDGGELDAGTGAPLSRGLTPIPNSGGPLLSHPNVVTVTFAGDPRGAALATFGASLASSSWLQAVSGEYGIRGGTSESHVLSSVPPASQADSDLLTFLHTQFEAGILPAPSGAPSSNVYLLYFPLGHVVIDAPGDQACTDYDGYHSEDTWQGQSYAYAVVLDCDAPSFANMSDLNEVTATASHELVEVVTDPLPDLAPAYADVDAGDPWGGTGGEVADRCGDSYEEDPNGYVLQRSWSNAEALDGGSPCVPWPAERPYYNVAPLSAAELVSDGGSASLELEGWSTAPTPPWYVRAETSTYGAFDPKPTLSTDILVDGETTVLTVTVPPGTPSGSQGVVYVFSAPQAAQSDFSLYPVTVTVP
ncbi:MAG: hypothetical protein ACYCWW_01090 [Deltaproteobacteria bacterium]